MKDSITSRVGRIISGSVHLLLQSLENAAPDAVMEQALREIDGVVEDIRAELGAVLARKHLASTRLMEENRKHEELTGKVELALREKREDLAEAAAARQLDIEAQIPVLETTLAESGDREKELTGYVTALLAKKREMEDELRQLRRAREQSAAASTVEAVLADSPAARQVGHEGRVARAESAFDRVLERQTGFAASRPATDSAAKLAELEALSRKHRIQERLQAAKARLGETQ